MEKNLKTNIYIYIYTYIHIYTYMAACLPARSLQSCLTLCDPMDCSPPGSSVHGILQARILEWVAISSSRGHGSSQPKEWTPISCTAGRFFTTEPLGKPIYMYIYVVNNAAVNIELMYLFELRVFSRRMSYIYIYIWLHHAACGILVPWPGIESGSMAVKALGLNHWATREVSIYLYA